MQVCTRTFVDGLYSYIWGPDIHQLANLGTSLSAPVKLFCWRQDCWGSWFAAGLSGNRHCGQLALLFIHDLSDLVWSLLEICAVTQKVVPSSLPRPE